jgi:hypothetical protein
MYSHRAPSKVVIALIVFDALGTNIPETKNKGYVFQRNENAGCFLLSNPKSLRTYLLILFSSYK